MFFENEKIYEFKMKRYEGEEMSNQNWKNFIYKRI